MIYFKLINFYKYSYIKVVIIIKSYVTNQFLNYIINEIFKKKTSFIKAYKLYINYLS